MKGFTLSEIFVTVLIFTFIIGGMYGVLNIANTNYGTNLASLNLQREARQGMSWLSREVRQAYWQTDIAGQRIDPVITGPDANGNYAITFNTPDALDPDEVNYSVSNGQLRRTYPGSAGQVKIRANDIIGLNFSQGSGHILTITVTASKTFSSFGRVRTLTFPLTQQVEVRNQ